MNVQKWHLEGLPHPSPQNDKGVQRLCASPGLVTQSPAGEKWRARVSLWGDLDEERPGTVRQEKENGRRTKVWTAGREESLVLRDRTGRGVSPPFACLTQESRSVVCQGEQVAGDRHSKGNGFLLGSCQVY